MNRILFEKDEICGDCVTFDGARAEHVLNVLHGEIGQVLKTGVVDGLMGTSTIEKIEPLPPDSATGLAQGRITVRCVHDQTAVAPWVDLLMAPPRPRALKRLLPQLAQMGVRRIVLVGAEKVEKAFWGAQLLKEEIYRPLLLDGLMQAGTTAMPTIHTHRSFRHYLEKGGFDADFGRQPLRVVAHPHVPTGEISLRDKISSREKDAVASEISLREEVVPVVAIGPEGGWTDEEVAMLQALGFVGMSLGPRILRTDTATIAVLAKMMP